VKRRVILDTDLAMGEPGSEIDDGFALALALADPGLDVELVTTVNGNTDVDTATRLARDLLERLGRPEIPVAGGGDDAAASAIVERVADAPGELTIVAIGPLTNVAVALQLEPQIASGVREIVGMGGIYLGHTHLAAMPGEFNFWVDPAAAAAVLSSGAPLRLVGLDVTRKVRLTREHAAAMTAGGRSFGAFAGDCTLGWIDHMRRHLPGDPAAQDSCAMHDPLAVAVVTSPDLVTWRPAYVQVETTSPITRGVAIADLLTSAEPPAANCRIATDVDVDGFLSLFLHRVASLG